MNSLEVVLWFVLIIAMAYLVLSRDRKSQIEGRIVRLQYELHKAQEELAKLSKKEEKQ